MNARFVTRAAVCVVMAAGGYPGAYLKGAPITGLDAAEALEDVLVFHAGTERDADGRTVTAGGRVLGVTALGDTIAAARDRAYDAVSRIRWDGEQHRRDIAADAFSAVPPLPPRSRG
jgi:phosphoribosylamine--glycine ligase